MSDVAHLLLYGTLRRAEPAHAALGLDRALRFVGPATLTADLWDLGEYPGLVPGDGTVHAELHRIVAPGIVAVLDRHEGWDERRPADALFRRERWPVAREGRCLDAWLYVYARPLAGARRIPGGVWS